MSEPHVISILTNKYAHLKGELKAVATESRRLQSDMHHIEAVIRIFRQDWEGRKIKAVRPRKPTRWTKPRQGMRYAIEVLKVAVSPLTTKEIALRTVELAKLPDPDKHELWAMASAINTGLKRLLGNGVESDGCRPAKWRITPPVANTPPIHGLPARS